MARRSLIGLDRETFERLRAEYSQHAPADLLAVRLDGRPVYGAGRCSLCHAPDCQAANRHVILECLRWGECTIYDRQPGRLRWGVPLLENEKLRGGIVACVDEREALPDDADAAALDLRAATADLRRIVERANLTNAALLAIRRAESEEERKRAEAIHETKTGHSGGILELYLREGPELISAVRQGRRQEAIRILNRILVQIYHLGSGRLDLLKSFLLELVVAMSRAGVEAGGMPGETLGANYASLAELGQIDSEEELSRWVVRMLNRTMDTIRRTTRRSRLAVVREILAYLESHYAEPIAREDAARAAHVSPSLLSHVLKQTTSRGFSDHLNQIRVDRASELLRRTDMSLLAVALEVGFSDQSYFTKIFRRLTGITPRAYRLQHPPAG